MSGDFNLAEDLVQETFYRAGRSLFFKGKINFVSSWLFTIARNLYLDHTKKRKLRLFPIDDIPEARQLREINNNHLPSKALEEKEKREKIQSALASLKENQRTILLLRDFQELTYQEITEVMKISPQAVKSLLFRARRSFMKEYSKIYQD